MIALLGQPVHLELLKLTHMRGFKSDSRSVAKAIGANVDEVNMALSRLLRLGLIEVGVDRVWRDKTGLTQLTPQQFRKYVAERVKTPLADSGE